MWRSFIYLLATVSVDHTLPSLDGHKVMIKEEKRMYYRHMGMQI